MRFTPSVSGILRELRRNGSLMLALGFRLRAPFDNRSGSLTIDPVCELRASSNVAMSRFQHTLDQAEDRCDTVSALFESMRLRLQQQLDDFAVHIGYDGKKNRSQVRTSLRS